MSQRLRAGSTLRAALLLLAAVLLHYPSPGFGQPADADADGVPDSSDNCPYASNVNQQDTGGIESSTPDGIGNACQCGDVSGNGIVTNSDVGLIKRHGLLYPALDAAFLDGGNCDVTGNGRCNGQDANATARKILGLEPNPRFGQVCHNANPNAAPCSTCGPCPQGTCNVCGDGVKNGTEACEGNQFGGATCSTVTAGTQPFGVLTCTSSCTIDSSGCTATSSCGGCQDCGNQACVNGACSACTSDDQCCAPLVCGLGGWCELILPP